MLTTESDESVGLVVVKKEAGMTDVIAASAVLTATLSPVVVKKEEETEKSITAMHQVVVKKEEKEPVDGVVGSPAAGRQRFPFRIYWRRREVSSLGIDLSYLSDQLSDWPSFT